MIIACGNTPEHSAVANMLPAPLLDRCIVLYVDSPRIDSWADWMNSHYANRWDKRVYAFNKRFESEGYLLKVPKKVETLFNFPTPRSWTDVALLLKAGIEDSNIYTGLLGPEIGQKFNAFLKVRVDLGELMEEPHKFVDMSLDAQYMSCVMFGTWLAKQVRKKATLEAVKKGFPLVDVMAKMSRDLLVLTCMSMKRQYLTKFLKILFKHDSKYMSILDTVVLRLKSELIAG